MEKRSILTFFCFATFLLFGFIRHGWNERKYIATTTNVFSLTLLPNFKCAKFNRHDSLFVSKLFRGFNYKGDKCVYSRTSLIILRDGVPMKNCVYQNRDNKSQLLIDLTSLGQKWYYLVINRDYKTIGKPGTGGISYHPNPSRTHIICLNCEGNSRGVPIDHGIKGGWPKPEFSDNKISWTHSFVDKPKGR